MKFLAPDHVEAIYLPRGPIPVKRPAKGKAYLVVDEPTQGELMQLAGAGFVPSPVRAEKVPAK